MFEGWISAEDVAIESYIEEAFRSFGNEEKECGRVNLR